MSHIFISYSHENTAIMLRVRDSLRAAGLATWTDENLVPGTASWKDAIERAIEAAGAMVALLSPDAKASSWCERERDYAGAQGVRVYAVLAEGDTKTAIPLDLINAQYVDLRGEAVYRPGIDRLIVELKTHLAASGDTEPPQPSSARQSAQPRKSTPILIAAAVIALVVVTGVLATSGLLGGASPTPTPAQPSETSTPSVDPAVALALAGVTSNSQWSPYTRDFDGVTMVLVPKGCFQMGSDSGEPDEKPVHKVCFDQPFWLDAYEVTQAQFAKIGGQAAQPAHFTGDNLPRETITWTESDAFCKKRGMRLPTEAEWEYAARGPDGLTYPWGDDFIAGNVIFDDNSDSKTWDAGSALGGKSWVGAFDLSGNVWEWVSDWYGDYQSLPQTNPPGPGAGTSRVLRGGSWLDFSSDVRLTFRGRYRPDYVSEGFGFRCARSISVTPQ